MIDLRVCERGGDSVRVSLEGDLSGRLWTDRIYEALEEHFVDDGVAVIRIDLSGVSFMDNYGVATLVTLQRQSGERGKRFMVEGSAGQVRDKLKVTGVLRILEEGG